MSDHYVNLTKRGEAKMSLFWVRGEERSRLEEREEATPGGKSASLGFKKKGVRLLFTGGLLIYT